jgi:hypothetical protein
MPIGDHHTGIARIDLVGKVRAKVSLHCEQAGDFVHALCHAVKVAHAGGMTRAWAESIRATFIEQCSLSRW